MKATIKREPEKDSGFLIGLECNSVDPVTLTTFKGEDALSITLEPKEADLLAELLINRKKALESADYIEGRTIYGTLEPEIETEAHHETHS